MSVASDYIARPVCEFVCVFSMFAFSNQKVINALINDYLQLLFFL